MLDLLQIFVDNIAPVLLIAFIGFLVGRRFQLDPRMLGTIIFNVLSPSIVFYSLYSSDLGGGEFVTLYGATFLFQFIMLGAAFAVTRFVDATPVERANLMLAAFCLNAGNYGLPLVDYAFGAEALSRATVVFVANVTLNYTLGVYVASNGRYSPLQALRNVLRTPAVYALAAALGLRALDVSLPLVVERPISSLAEAAIPMMLIMLGLQLGQFARSGNGKLVATGVSLKLLLAPLVAIAIAAAFMLTGSARPAFIVQASMPTAVLTLIFSTEFELDRNLALNLIMASTLLSPLTLSILIAVLR